MAASLFLEAVALLVGAGAFLASLGGTLHAWRWARAPVALANHGFRPFATVIVPCRGAHHGFEANVRALATQSYPAYELLFVVDEKDDPCALALDALRGEGLRYRVVLSAPDVVGDAWATGKIVAQLTGVQEAARDSAVLVFADADARPGPQWLAHLVAPLVDPAVGGVTGYRWYAPATRATFWTALRDAWNAVGLDALTMDRLRFLWGGSMAVRHADFARSDVARHWRTLVSEDVGLGRAMRDLGLHLCFAPGAMVASVEDWSRGEVLEWCVRQTALTRQALPRVYAFAGVVYAASLALLVVGAGLVALWPSTALGFAGLGMLMPVLSAAPRAWLRERMVRRALGPAAGRPAPARLLHLALSVGLAPFMLWVLARARRVERIAWRGRSYAVNGRSP